MEKRNRNILILSIIALVALFTGLSFAYFSARITGLESASTLSLTAGRMGIVYSEDDATVSISNIYPRSEAWITKQITLTGYNTTDQPMKYDLGINVTTNTFTNGYLTYDLRLVSGTNGSPIQNKTGIVIADTGKIKIGKGTFLAADGDSHIYELKIYFKDNGRDQNDAQDAVFNAKIYVSEPQPNKAYIALTEENSEDYQIISSYDIDHDKCIEYYYFEDMTEDDIADNETLCNDGTIQTLSGDYSISIALNSEQRESLIESGVVSNLTYDTERRLIDNTIYTDGQYNYYYVQDNDTWGVELADKESTNPVTTELLSAINDKPITIMVSTFYYSKAASIDLSSFDTSNVTNMSSMFAYSAATTLDLSSFDTSHLNSFQMNGMFTNCAATTIIARTDADAQKFASDAYEQNAAEGTSIYVNGVEKYRVSYAVSGGTPFNPGTLPLTPVNPGANEQTFPTP